MLEIKCSRCGTVNVGVSADAPCTHCGTILNAPLSAIDDGSVPPSSATSSANGIEAEEDAVKAPVTRNRMAAAVTENPEPGGEERYE